MQVPEGYQIKRPLWTTGTRLPTVTVEEVAGDNVGSAQLMPTADGLPGPIPASLQFPSPGCWRVVAKTERGEARIFIRVQERDRS